MGGGISWLLDCQKFVDEINTELRACFRLLWCGCVCGVCWCIVGCLGHYCPCVARMVVVLVLFGAFVDGCVGCCVRTV